MKRFNHKMTLLENKVNSDLAEDNWLEIKSLYGKIEVLGPNTINMVSGIDFGLMLSQELHLIHCWHDEDISKQSRIKFEDEIYKIERLINVDFKNKYWRIIAIKLD